MSGPPPPPSPGAAAVAFRRRCQACGQMLAFVKTPSGKAAPMEVDGEGNVTPVNHFSTCVDAKRFSRKGARQEQGTGR
jgi:hypothetical protein